MTPSQDSQPAWDWISAHWEAVIAWLFGAGATWATFRSKLDNHQVRIERLENDGPASMKRLEDKMDAHHTQVIGLMMGLAANRQPPP